MQWFLFTALLIFSVFAKSTLYSQSFDEKVSTRHTVNAWNTTIEYEATAGYLTLREENGEPRANVFYIAYTAVNSDAATRPITFTFNGGPGSSSVWLHMGGLGPKRVVMDSMGSPLKPPYSLTDNEYSWLEFTDLVFIDPVETGFSRPAEGIDKKDFNGYTEDIESVGAFINLYTGKHHRWSSPKYLCGESYGTTRAAGLSHHLQSRYGMYLNGLVMVSSIMNFQTARFDRGNDLPYILFLPTYATSAWYHNAIERQHETLEDFLSEVEAFALGDYTLALMQGDMLTTEQQQDIARRLSAYTGLSEEYLVQSHLRIHIGRFVKEVLRDRGKTIGRLDSRFIGYDYDHAGERYDFDPSLDYAIMGPYSTTVNHYLRTELGWDTHLPYEILTGRVHPWNYSNVQNTYLNVAEELRKAMHRNHHLRVLICNGYYDLATPYFATEYTVNTMFVDPSLKGNIEQTFYEAGHMMYIHFPSLVKFSEDVRAWYKRGQE